MNHTSMRRALGLSLVFLACFQLSAGCSSERAASQLIEVTTARTQADAWVHDAYAELAALRRDLATTRIAIAKQEGEAAELRRNTTVLEADRAELRKMLEQAHATVIVLQNEQNDLKQALAQTQAVNLVRQNSSTPTKLDETTIQADMTALNARMMQLTDELTQLKQHFPNKIRTASVRTSRESAGRASDTAPGHAARDEITQLRIVPNAVLLLPSADATPRLGHAGDFSSQQSLIRVQPGDSLWKLAHAHATSIDELKRVNGLTTDVVHVGQRLLLPSHGEPDVLGALSHRAAPILSTNHAVPPVREIEHEGEQRDLRGKDRRE